MSRITITCSGEAWKQSAIDFKSMADKYQADSISSKKMPNGTRIMEYKVEDFSNAEAFQQDCASLAGFTADFESL
jgi:hypothetical protein